MKLKNNAKKLIISTGAMFLTAAPLISVVSCTTEEPVALKSAAYAAFLGDKETMLNTMLNTSSVQGSKPLNIKLYDEKDGTNYRIVGGVEGYTIDLSDEFGEGVSPTGMSLYTVEQLTETLSQVNVELNKILQPELIGKTGPDLQKYMGSLRLKTEFNNQDQSVTFWIVRTDGFQLEEYVDNVFFKPGSGVELIDNVTQDLAWQYFGGIAFINYNNLSSRYHLDKNFSNEAEFATATNMQKITNQQGKTINAFALTPNGQHDIYVYTEPVLDFETAEFSVRFNFYQGGTPMVGNKDNVQGNWKTRVVRDVPLTGAFPKSTTDGADYQANAETFHTALNTAWDFAANHKAQLKSFSMFMGGVLNEPINVINDTLPVFTQALINNEAFRRAIYVHACENENVSMEIFLSTAKSLTFNKNGTQVTHAAPALSHVNPLDAKPEELKLLLSAVMFVYYESDFIKEYAHTHP